MDLLWVYEIPLWVVPTSFLLVLLLAMEAGRRLGLRKVRSQPSSGAARQSDVTLGAMLGLLGLMLAFTYAFSLSRFDTRKNAVIDEANAIGTAFLRADLASEPSRSELRTRLLEYARTRVVTADMAHDREELLAVIHRSLEAQAKLWPATMAAVEDGMPAPLAASLVQAVNEVLDRHTVRTAATYDRLPGATLVLLLLIAAVSIGMAARRAVCSGIMGRLGLISFSLILTALMYIIIDFDTLVRGFIRVDQQSLIILIRDLETAVGA